MIITHVCAPAMHSNSIVVEQAITEASLVKESESVVAHLRHVQRSKK